MAFVGVLAFAPGAALAQNAVKDSALGAYAMASPSSNPTDEPAASADSELSADEIAILNSLNTALAKPNPDAPARTLRLPRLSYPTDSDIKRTELPDGSSTVAVKQPLPIEWDAKVGADLGLASNTAEIYQPGTYRPSSGSGAAWASVGVLPNLATIDARVDPTNDQGKVGTTFKHSVPLGGKFAVTVQNTFSVTGMYGAAPVVGTTTSAPPAPQIMTQVWGNEKAAKFDVLTTGTSFGAGLVTASNDPVTHNKFSADQKLYGPLHITTAVTDVGQTTASKSITAGLKLNW